MCRGRIAGSLFIGVLTYPGSEGDLMDYLIFSFSLMAHLHRARTPSARGSSVSPAFPTSALFGFPPFGGHRFFIGTVVVLYVGSSTSPLGLAILVASFLAALLRVWCAGLPRSATEAGKAVLGRHARFSRPSSPHSS